MLNSNLDNRNYVPDLFSVADIGKNARRIVHWNMNTLNTPYKSGLTVCSAGIAYVNMDDVSYGTIFCIPASDESVFTCSKAGGTWFSWKKIKPNTDAGTLYFSGLYANKTITTLSNWVRLDEKKVSLPRGKYIVTLFANAYNAKAITSLALLLDAYNFDTVKLAEKVSTYTNQIGWNETHNHTFIFDQWYADSMDFYLWVNANGEITINYEIMAIRIS